MLNREITACYGMLLRAGQERRGASFLARTNILKRMAGPEEIANAIVFVGSNKASCVTGQSFSVDGGHATG